MNTLSTHVLDTMHGRPAAGLSLAVTGPKGEVARGTTNADGRCPDLIAGALPPGRYAIRFAVAAYFRAQGVALPDPPFLDDPAAGAQSIGRIPAQKLILLNADMPNLAENPGLVRENVTKDMQLALAELLPALRKYERISLVGGDDSLCEPFRDAFTSFCEENNLTWRLIPGTEEAIPTAGEAFFVLSDDALMRLVGQINQSDLEPGRDVGMVAYRENDAKKTMLNGITTISPDFKAAGKAVADMVSTGHLQQIDNPFRVCVRASL